MIWLQLPLTQPYSLTLAFRCGENGWVPFGYAVRGFSQSYKPFSA